jgi:hypothetical protein
LFRGVVLRLAVRNRRILVNVGHNRLSPLPGYLPGGLPATLQNIRTRKAGLFLPRHRSLMDVAARGK